MRQLNTAPAWAGLRRSQHDATLWTDSQKPHFARDGVARARWAAAGQGARDLGPGPGLLRGATTPATPGSTRRCCRRRSAGRCASRACAMRGTAGTPRAPASIHRARAALDRDGARDRLCLREQGLLAHQTSTPTRRPRLQPRRPADGPAVEVVAGLWRARRILRLRQQAAGLGNDRALAQAATALHGTAYDTI